jgi:hypothetical protein
LLAVAAREALGTVGAELPWPRERIGVSAGTWNAGGEAMYEVVRTVLTVSPAEAPPMLFPSTVANAAASQLGILERLAGPNLTHTEKQAAGLRAVVEAGRLLVRGRADAVIACGVDEAPWTYVEAHARLRALRSRDRPGVVPGEGVALLPPGRRATGWPADRGWGAARRQRPHRYPDTTEPVAACRAALQRPASVRRRRLGGQLRQRLAGLTAEREALETVFGSHRPALAVTDRLGEGVLRDARALAALPSWAAVSRRLAGA